MDYYLYDLSDSEFIHGGNKANLPIVVMNNMGSCDKTEVNIDFKKELL